jgi:hypothetical protein
LQAIHAKIHAENYKLQCPNAKCKPVFNKDLAIHKAMIFIYLAIELKTFTRDPGSNLGTDKKYFYCISVTF